MGAIADEVYQQLGEEGGNLLASQIGGESSQRFEDSISGALQSVVKVAGMSEVVWGGLQRHIMKKMEDSASAAALFEAMRQDTSHRGYAQVKVFRGKKMRTAMDQVLHALANMFEREGKLASAKDRWARRETCIERAATRINREGEICVRQIGNGLGRGWSEICRMHTEGRWKLTMRLRRYSLRSGCTARRTNTKRLEKGKTAGRRRT